MRLPELAQRAQRQLRQRDVPVFAALGRADVYPMTLPIDITDLKLQTLTQAQAHAVDRQKEHP